MIDVPALLFLMALAVGPAFHTTPECWPAPRYTHRAASVEFTDRVSLAQAPTAVAFDGELSPNRGYQFQHESGVDEARLRIDVEQGRQWLLRLRGAAWQPEARWVNEKLLYLRVHWGRIVASDLLIDVERGEVLLHELADEGSIAFQQYQQACAGRCPCPTGAAEDPPAPAPLSAAPLLGLGEIDGVGEGVEQLPQALLVRAAPNAQAPSRALASLADFQTRELSYEQPALLVYALQDGWLQIALADGQRAWVNADQVRLHPIEVIVLNRLNYLHRDWDGRLWSAPGQALALDAKTAGAETSVRVLDAMRYQQRSWLQLEVYDRSECEGGGPPQVVARGWVPAHQSNGEPLVWFHSRGC